MCSQHQLISPTSAMRVSIRAAVFCICRVLYQQELLQAVVPSFQNRGCTTECDDRLKWKPHTFVFHTEPLLSFRTIGALNWKTRRDRSLRIVTIWTASSEFGTYSLCEQRRFRRACASAQSRQNLRCSLIQAVSQEEPSDRKPDPWPR